MAQQASSAVSATPGPDGTFGRFGGRMMPEALMAALDELTLAWRDAMRDAAFTAEFQRMLREYAGVPSLLYDATKLSEQAGARILLKREDLNHTGAHKIRNVLGQALLTRRMGKTPRDRGDRRRDSTASPPRPLPPTSGSTAWSTWARSTPSGRPSTSRACTCSAPRWWRSSPGRAPSRTRSTRRSATGSSTVDHTAYLFGTAAGPHPFPSMVRDFCRGIGDEARAQCLELTGSLPDAAVACVGGGSNAIGLFAGFLDDADVQLVGCEAAGDGVDTMRHAATIYAQRVRRAPRRPHVRAPGRGRSDPRVALDLGGPRLPRRRPAARPPRRDRPRDVPTRDRRRGDGRVRAALAHRGHHPGDRVGARRRRRDAAGEGAARARRSW